MGAITKVLLALGVFAIGVTVGWLVRDSDRYQKIESAGAVQPEQREATAANRLHRLQKLFDSNRFEAAVSGMHGLSEIDHSNMREYLYQTAANLIERGECEQQLRMFAYYFQQFERSAPGLLLQARCQILLQHYEAAVSDLYEARTFEISVAEEKSIAQLLTVAVLNQDQAFRAEGKLDELDYFYQNLLVQEPEQSAYYMQLGLIRRELGDVNGSIGALLQIQNDQVLGVEARKLLEQMQQEKTEIRSSAEIVPLQLSGSQLIVNAVMDGQYPLRMLLDTGAAITVVEPEVLIDAGYRLDEAKIANFTTANGRLRAPVVRIENLAIRSHVETALFVGALPLDLGADADGLLGMNFLRHYRFVVDQAEQRLYLSRRK
jgi:predicted aspartyl protease